MSTMPDEIYLGKDQFHYTVPVSSTRPGAVRYVRADRPLIASALALIDAVNVVAEREAAKGGD